MPEEDRFQDLRKERFDMSSVDLDRMSARSRTEAGLGRLEWKTALLRVGTGTYSAGYGSLRIGEAIHHSGVSLCGS